MEREIYSIKCVRKEERFQMNNLKPHLKNLEKEKQNKPKVSIRKEIIQEHKSIENRKTTLKSITNSWLFDMTNTIDKPLAKV